MIQTVAVDVQNRQGELARIVGLVAARNINIDELTAVVSSDPAVVRVTMALVADETAVDRLVKVLERQVHVLTATRLSWRKGETKQ